jgi:uncharacterized protein YlzI (FlbEa/FlbD family)
MVTLKTITPKPGTPTATVRDDKDKWKRGKSGVIDGVKVWIKGDSPTGGSGDYNRSPYHERAAYLINQMLCLKIVPPTAIRLIDGKVVSAQKFVRGRRPDIARPPLLELFDYIINNTDRHDGNWFVKPSGRVWAIDNALTFGTYIENFDVRGLKLPYRIRYHLMQAVDNPQRFHRRLDSLIGEEAVNAVMERIQKVVKKISRKRSGK